MVTAISMDGSDPATWDPALDGVAPRRRTTRSFMRTTKFASYQ